MNDKGVAPTNVTPTPNRALTCTVQLANGRQVQGTLGVWIAGILSVLPDNLQATICDRVEKIGQSAIVRPTDQQIAVPGVGSAFKTGHV